MRRMLFILLLVGLSLGAKAADQPTRRLILVRGASGAPEYGKQFDQWAERWITAARDGDFQIERIGPNEDSTDEPQTSDRDRLLKSLTESVDAKVTELWLVLIGHGTYDSKTARFNLRGPDVSAGELKATLEGRQARTIIINGASASGPFLEAMKGPQRVVITATKTGNEQNFARFGDFFSAAVGSREHDLDKDGQTSLLEAFLVASRQTSLAYSTDGRLETEHAILDDNGDGEGIRADWYQGLRLVKRPDRQRVADGLLAQQIHLRLSPTDRVLSPEQRQRRDELVRAINALRQKKAEFKTVDEYFNELEKLCVELARIETSAAKRQ